MRSNRGDRTGFIPRRRYRKNSDERGEDHAAKNRSANVAACELRRAGRDHKGIKAQDEGKRCHHHRPEAQPRTLRGGFRKRNSLLTQVFGKFDDQNSVLGDRFVGGNCSTKDPKFRD